MKSNCKWVSYCREKCCKVRLWRRLHNSENTLRIIEFYLLDKWILWYINFISIKVLTKQKEGRWTQRKAFLKRGHLNLRGSVCIEGASGVGRTLQAESLQGPWDEGELDLCNKLVEGKDSLNMLSKEWKCWEEKLGKWAPVGSCRT